MCHPATRSPATPLLLMAIFLATGLTAQEAAAQVQTAVTSTDAVSDGEVTEVRRRRRRRAVEDEERTVEEDEEYDDEEYEEADREPREQVVVVEQEDKFGPLYCAICSCVAPPLWPLWVILMIVVDNDQPPTHMNRRQNDKHDPNGVPPPLKPMDEREHAMAVLY